MELLYQYLRLSSALLRGRCTVNVYEVPSLFRILGDYPLIPRKSGKLARLWSQAPRPSCDWLKMTRAEEGFRYASEVCTVLR